MTKLRVQLEVGVAEMIKLEAARKNETVAQVASRVLKSELLRNAPLTAPGK